MTFWLKQYKMQMKVLTKSKRNLIKFLFIGEKAMELLNAAKTGKKERPIKVLQFGEVRIADLTSLIVFVRVVNLRHNRRNQVHIQLRPHRRTPRRFPFRP